MRFNEASPGTLATNEADTNADTCCLGKNFLVLSHTTRVADVYAYDKAIAPIENVPIVTGATAYDCPITQRTFILIFHESLFYGTKLDHSLVNPNQVRHYGVPFWDNPFDRERGLCIDATDELKIHLMSKGTKIVFDSRVPTQDELTNCEHVEMTSQSLWEPSSVTLSISATTMREPIQQVPVPWKRSVRSMMTEAVTLHTEAYVDPRSNEAELDNIDPLLVNLSGGRQVGSMDTRIDEDTIDLPARRTFVSTERHGKITAESLAERFGIGINRARQTLHATLQRGMRSAILPIARRYRADRVFTLRRLAGKYSSDTAWFKVRSLRGNIASQIYFHKCGFAANYHVSAADGEQVGNTLTSFLSDYGVPEHLTVDGASVQVGRNTPYTKIVRKHAIQLHVSTPRRPNENPAEGGIREIKRKFYRYVQKYDIPMRLWDFVLDYTVELMNVTVNGSKYSQGRVPLEIITGITPDISEWLDFHIYQWVHYKTNAGLGPQEIGRWLGVSHRTGPIMTYWVLPKSGRPISCDTVQRVTKAEMETEETKGLMDAWTTSVAPILEAKSSHITLPSEEASTLFDLQSEDEEFIKEFQHVGNDPALTETDNAMNDTEDPFAESYLNMEVGIRTDPEEEPQRGTVKRRKLDEDGKPVGVPNDNPLLDTRQYEVQFEDGRVEVYSANILAENILAQVDDQGHRQLMIDEIVDHRVGPTAIPMSKGTYRTRNGTTRKVLTTRGWDIYVQWKDGSGKWISFKDMKESFPIELAEYGKNHGLLDEPVFAWWARRVLKKRDSVIKKVKSRYWERTHKYGIRVPKTIEEAKRIDKENGNTLWMDAIRLEMKNVRVAFEEHEGDPSKLVGFEEITGHIVFDVKLGENFRRKARFCADGHKTKAPSSVTYSSVVSRDSVRIILTIAALNEISIKCADVQNAFLTAPNLEKCYMYAGEEFGEEKGKLFIVRRALYGLKSASASFRAFMASRLDEMGFKSSMADPDVWMRPAIKPDGSEYYEYLLMYVDDILCASDEPIKVMRQIQERFKFKNDKIEDPDGYLGAKIAKRQLDGKDIWTMTSSEYVAAAIKTVEESIKDTKWTIPKKVRGPMAAGYVPELDSSPELEDEDLTRYRECIGILRWAIEIGRVDIVHEVSVLSQYQAVAREGHLEQVLHMFGYLKKKGKLTLYFDPRLPNIDYSGFKMNKEEFKIHYRDAEEEMPHSMPKARGPGVSIVAFVDASHAANKKTRRSHTGYVIFINKAPILWYSKRQNTVESSTFSSEFLALRTCIEAITHLRFKLRMFGIPIMEDEPAHVFCDNESVVKNSSMIESTLNKKHSSIAYHYVRWNVAAGVIAVSWIDTKFNIADAMTKRLAEAVRDFLFGSWTY